MEKKILPEQERQIIEIDGFEVTVSFTDEARPEVFQRVKQILLSSAELKSDMDAA